MTVCIWVAVPLVVLVLLTGASHAATLSEARSAAIGWLESHQNADGSWGSGERRALVTPEALLALAKAERSEGAPAQRAQTWLLNQRHASLDYRARAVRALQASGVDVSREAAALNAMGNTGGACPFSELGYGWGPTSEKGITSYDSALVLAAIKIGGLTPNCQTQKFNEVLSRVRSDHGWSGDHLLEPSVSPSDRTVSAEIVRAVSGVIPYNWSTSPSRWFLSTNVANGGAAVDSQSDTLEIAARLAAIHAIGQTDAGLETELLSRSSASVAWSATDAFVNAMGLLAVTTRPNTSFPTTCPNPADTDCDTFLDSVDAFPHDAAEHADSDGDGIGDVADPDRDGDGFCDPGETGACSGAEAAAFADDPTEHADSDNDGIGDNDEVDADGDGVSTAEEIERGTDPTLDDTDGDGENDSADNCPLIASGVDADQDGVCAPLDGCDGQPDPLDLRNLDGDLFCDEADDDDDDDSFPDPLELAAGSDPRDANSVPENLAVTDPDGDFDRDALKNEDELVTSPYLADTDGDGATDSYELGVVPATAPNNPSSQPPPVIAVFSSTSTIEPDDPGDPFQPELTAPGLRVTVTGGQATPVALPGAPQAPSSGPAFANLAGFQPQTTLGRDLDGDGLTGVEEATRRTSATNVDTDGDLFADGPGGLVPLTCPPGGVVHCLPGGWDLEPDTKADGEADFGTDPANAGEHPGMPGDVAPLGHPNGRIDVADAMVEIRIVGDPTITAPLAPQNAAIALQAADANEDQAIDVGDALELLQAIRAEEP